MKKLLGFGFGLILSVLVLAGCATPQIQVEPQAQVAPNAQVQEIDLELESTNLERGPSGSYILVRYQTTGGHGSNVISADLVFGNSKVCTWDLGNTRPEDRGEDKLYFVANEDNCPEMDPRNAVIWYVHSNYGELYFNNECIDTLEVWSQTGTKTEQLVQK